MTAERAVRLRREAWGFAIGSLFFVVGAVPAYQVAVGDVITNLTFFVGAIFFTAAALIQLLLSGRRPPRGGAERADLYDWWAAAVQFAGTLFFNVSTTEALIVAANSSARVGNGWRPDALGSICFLVASALAVRATVDRERLWDPRARTWHGTWLNLIGSVLFGLSAVGAYTIPATGDLVNLFWANAGTFLGAACFFVAAVLSRRSVPVRVRGRRRSDPTASAGSVGGRD
ncbi:YrhK family protein [Leifsonia sp. fls2-241-R2A-40a]|uniref:YrhK family protein n=1 Tax=Leifsonia sp. fls2-241-R2A-40a TaxID=3040290 RepID=UPI0025504783|nr:YrhK family protein [Leifsonia sp. fls2-241-R2A-40a]